MDIGQLHDDASARCFLLQIEDIDFILSGIDNLIKKANTK